MPEVIRPVWEDLQEVVSSASTRLIVCAPFYSAKGVGRVFDHLRNSASLKFWTRLSPDDWRTGVSDPDELLALLDILDSNGVEVTLGIHQRLHAKAYVADQDLALIGSANLSDAGFGMNLELAVRFRGEEALHAIDTLEIVCTPVLQTVALEQLRNWVEFSRATIEEARSAALEEPERLELVQSELDRILGFGGADPSGITEPDLSDMEEFVQWLDSNDALPGAEVLYNARYGRNQHSGHFRQGFFASMRFLSEHSDLRASLSEELDRLGRDDVYQLNTSPRIASLWQVHLDSYATDERENHYSYPTLRSILPASLGGTVSGGGGAGPTIKRMLPLVARFTLKNDA